MSLLLANGKAFINKKLVKKNILIDKGRIKKISSKKMNAKKEIDCKGKIILPGVIDCHVHFRTPGFEYKEDWFTGSLAALHGGVTTVMDMPNTNPAIVTKKSFEYKKRLVEKNSLVNFDIYIAATKGNLGEIKKTKPRAVKLYFGSTTGDILLNSEKDVEELFRLGKKMGFIVVCHAEDEAIVKENEKKYTKEKNAGVHLKIRSAEAEEKAIEKLLGIQSKIGNKVHVAHVSSKKGLELIQKAKKRKFGKNITCETTPNYLFLDSGDYKKLGTLMKCNPAIKSKKDREALFEGLKKRTIDIVATDHAPHLLKEKKQSYWKCPSGIPGIETMLPLLLDAESKKQITLKRIVEATSEEPARIFGWSKKGQIKKGFDADFVIVNPKKSFKIKNENLFTKAKYSPFHGKTLKGVIENTIVRGDIFG